MKKLLLTLLLLLMGSVCFGGITPTIVPLTPVWTMTPVATASYANINVNRVYYDPDTHNIIESVYLGGLVEMNAQMTPIVTAATMGSGVLLSYKAKYNSQYFGVPVNGPNVYIYNTQLTPIATVITNPTIAYPPSFDTLGNVWELQYVSTSSLTLNKWLASAFATPGVTPIATYTLSITSGASGDYLDIDSNNNLYISCYAGNIKVYNNAVTPIATIGAIATDFRECYVSSDGHILESARTNPFFKVYTNYLSPTPVVTWV